MECNKKLVHIKIYNIQAVNWLNRYSKIILELDYNVFIVRLHIKNFQKDYTEANQKNWEIGKMDGSNKSFLET